MASFADDVSRWCAKVKVQSDLALQKIGLELFTRVIMRSPVDTGRFRGNWQVQINLAPTGQLDRLDKGGGETVAAAAAGVAQAHLGDVLYLANNVPYARRLEYGWSKQAPTGMVRVTLQEFQGVVEMAAAEVSSGG